MRDIADEDSSIEVRSLACVILKNFIINRTKVSFLFFSSSFYILIIFYVFRMQNTKIIG